MRCLFLTTILIAAAGAAQAGDIKLQSLDGTVTFSGSFGLSAIKANEYVYQGSFKASQLIWKSRYVDTVNGMIAVDLDHDWYASAEGMIGFNGDGHLADYDWFQRGAPWSDRSLHPDTRLNHYFALGAEVGRTLISRDNTEIGLGAGFKYTDVQWSAWGGSYIYSDRAGFRDVRGHFDPDQKGITYRQVWPVPYIGVNLSHTEGAWSFSSSVRGGVSVNAYDIDDHWVRSLRFIDDFDTTPTLSLTSSVNYALSGRMSLYLSGSLDRMFKTRADTETINESNGKTFHNKNDAGGDFSSAMISFGLKGQF
jgi:omptin